jgi:hypothetical protein
MKSALRDIATAVFILLALGAVGLVEVRVHVSPGEFVVCIAPVGSCK